MSLPQRKKSAEEIAKLRESLGILGPPSDEESLMPEIPLERESGILEAISAVTQKQEPAPTAEIYEPKVEHSLKLSERIPALPTEESAPQHPPARPPEPRPALPVSSPTPAPTVPKIVRSLRKSEQGPRSAIQTSPPDSRLPTHRHSDEQLNRIRRQEVLAQSTPAPHPLSLTAHLLIVVPGYLFALAGAACFIFYDIEKRQMPVTIGLVLAALAIAAFIFFKKPLSRHHAAFIGVISLFVIIFGALYYFPTLQHGT